MKTVLITGASAGIGLAAAEYLAEKGYQVFGTTRSISKRQAVIDELKSRYQDRIHFIEMDVTSDDSVKKSISGLIAKIGSLDAAVCNAGFGIYGSIEEMPLSKVREQLETNFFGYLRVIQAVLPGMRERKSGHVVLISSIAGIVAIPFQAHYSASKYAVEAITQGLRQELHGSGVKIAAVRPGDIRTEFNDAISMHLPENSPYQKRYEACWETIDKNMKAAPKPIIVAKKIHKILNTKDPKAYYSASDFFTSLLPVLAPFITQKMKEAVVRLFYGV